MLCPELRADARHALFRAIDRDSLCRGRATRPLPSQPTAKSLPNNQRTRRPITAWHGCSNRRDRSRRPIAITCWPAIMTVYRCGAAHAWKPPIARWRSATSEASFSWTDQPSLKARSRHGILDNHLFHDNVHPNLKGHVALAEAVLVRPRRRGPLSAGRRQRGRHQPRACASRRGIQHRCGRVGHRLQPHCRPLRPACIPHDRLGRTDRSGVIATVKRRTRSKPAPRPRTPESPAWERESRRTPEKLQSSGISPAAQSSAGCSRPTARRLPNSTHRSRQS